MVTTSTSPSTSPSASSSPGRARRAAVGGALAAAVLLLSAGPAAAHVTVNPGEAEQGGYATLNFKVPNERDDAATTRLEVVLPTDHPLASVMPQPVPGWQVKVTKGKLDKPVTVHGEQVTEAPTRIVWSGGSIEPGTFQQFPVSVGPLPENADHLVFKALQTYDSGEVVRWIEEPKEGAEEPESPAPVLRLTPAAAEEAASDDTRDAGAETAQAASDDDGGTDTTARVLAVVGIAVGALGLAFGLRRRRAEA